MAAAHDATAERSGAQVAAVETQTFHHTNKLCTSRSPQGYHTDSAALLNFCGQLGATEGPDRPPGEHRKAMNVKWLLVRPA
jgi:hypothetical protein